MASSMIHIAVANEVNKFIKQCTEYLISDIKKRII